jgi:predicted ATPase
LSRLGQRDTASLVERLTQGKALPREVAARIIELTDGIPLFVEELTKTVLEGGLLQEEDDRYVLAGSVRSIAIPASLHDSLLARLDRLAPVKEVAQIGAAIGREFSYDLLAAVAHRPERQLQDALDQLADAGLIFRRGVLPGTSFIFKHALVQDAAYGTLLRGRRQELHARIGTALEQAFLLQPEQLGTGEFIAVLARHWAKAEEWEKALTYTLKVAERARNFHAIREAINHYWEALDMVSRLPRTPE